MLYKPEKSLGQNFLLNGEIVQLMIDLLEVLPDDTVVEIGPGLGVLTNLLSQRLIDKESHIYAVEIDSDLTAKLKTMFLENYNLSIVNEDILTWLPNFSPDKEFKVLGSLPYYITSPILHALVKLRQQPELAVVLIQKEVAEKVAAKAPEASYLSAFLQTFYDVEFVKVVPRKMFDPVPKVDGGILRLKRREDSLPFDLIEKYEGFLHRAFSSPRKMLNKPFSKEELSKAGINPQLLPQNLDWQNWLDAFFRIVIAQ